MSSRPVGIFDSGAGGLTVLQAVKEVLPGESIIYVGDTANAPYGGKSYNELLGHGRDIILFLRSQGVKAIVLACGTTSSTVYEQLADECADIPLVDVIRPGVEACVELADLRLGLIATAATIKSGLFERMLKARCPGISLLTQACPLFAPMVEAGVTHGPIARWAAETYVGSWRGSIDALVLGCTHYPMLADTLAGVLGEDVRFINFASHTAHAFKNKLAAVGILNDGSAPPVYKYYVSGDPGGFDKTARFLLGESPGAKRINWG